MFWRVLSTVRMMVIGLGCSGEFFHGLEEQGGRMIAKYLDLDVRGEYELLSRN